MSSGPLGIRFPLVIASIDFTIQVYLIVDSINYEPRYYLVRIAYDR
jgi:hypothetical protein